MVDGVGKEEFGGEIAPGPAKFAPSLEVALRRQAEVDEFEPLRGAVGGNKDVGRLDVVMDDPRSCRYASTPRRVTPRLSLFLHRGEVEGRRAERLDFLAHKPDPTIVFAELGDADQIRMAQECETLELQPQRRDVFGRKQRDRDRFDDPRCGIG